MGRMPIHQIDATLSQGGWVITASDRAARSLLGAFNRARNSEGRSVWPTPKILDWKSFVRAAWQERALDGRLILNAAQEQALWADIVGNSNHLATLLEGPRHRLARMAMDAHELLCSHAPGFLLEKARRTWQQDSAAFSGWLAAFDQACRAQDLISPSRLPSELIALLQESDKNTRPPLLLAGFDRILPVQRNVFDAWGIWEEDSADESTEQVSFYEARDTHAELAACARWCSRQLAADPHARLLVVTQEASARRGKIERAFLQHTGSRFEFSLGVPLSRVGLARAAQIVLRWLASPIAEQELDWLLSTGYAAASAAESLTLQSYMRFLRRRGLERSQWTLKSFLTQPQADKLLPAAWTQRMIATQRHLESLANRPQSPLDWAGLVPQLLEGMAWTTAHTLSSTEFQASQRWQQALDATGSLGFDSRRIRWPEFLFALARTLDETLFAPESQDAPIQIAGPAESAGLSANAIWFLGASENVWPPSGPLHPLLPIEVQRDAGMPHATPQNDWDLAEAITSRLLASASEVYFSFARQNESAEARPSRLIAQRIGPPQALSAELTAAIAASPRLELYEDVSRIPFDANTAQGGSSVLTAQSQCPFKAFATARLGAQGWDLAQDGLSPSQRGQLLHAVLRAVWAGPPRGIHSRAELHSLKDLGDFVEGHVQRVLEEEVRPELRERLPRRYLELEGVRLAGLITEWLEYEASRNDFQVAGTEVAHTISLAGLTLNLRLDRVDRLVDDSLLVIDYKTGNVSPSAWELPRPEDVQLPLYASFALDGELGGLVFAKVRAGDQSFAGRVGDAKATLIPNLSGNNSLVKNSLTAEQIIDWREAIEQLARDFIVGRAEVDPRDDPKTCVHCGLETLCRISENRIQLDSEEDGAEVDNE